MSDGRIEGVLAALFDEGANFADYDEGKRADEPDGYFREPGVFNGVDEVRRRAVKRAVDGLGRSTVYVLLCIRYDYCWIAGVFSSEQTASAAVEEQLEPKGRAFGVYVENWTVDGERIDSVHHRRPEGVDG